MKELLMKKRLKVFGISMSVLHIKSLYCNIVANAHFIVTEDKHFNVLKNIEFPHVDVIGIDEFKDILGSS